MRGRLPMHAGHGPGLSERRLGAKGGAEKVTLTVNQLPSHTHNMKASDSLASSPNPATNVIGKSTVVDLSAMRLLQQHLNRIQFPMSEEADPIRTSCHFYASIL